MRKLVTTGAAVLVLLLAAIVLVRALTVRSSQITIPPVNDIRVDAISAAQRLAVAVSYPTVARTVDDIDTEALLGLHAFLADAYPGVHDRLSRTVVNELSLLYRWPGSDPTLDPLLLLGHLDVVPVQEANRGQWQQPPFAGVVQDGWIWGRGAMDDKAGVLGALEAVEALITDGFSPQRTVLLAFGHDEEVGGSQGAQAIVAHLEDAGTRPFLVLDEGMSVVEGLVPGLTAPAALIGVAEKGFLSLELTATATGGHSSVPPADTAVGRVARAVVALESHPLPARLSGPTEAFFAALVPEMPLAERLVLANRWLFGPLIKRQLSAAPSTNAVIRTTTAPTMLTAGVKPNVLPTTARAVVNFRIHPADSIAIVVEHVRQVIDDPAVTVSPLDGFQSEPSAVSPLDHPAFDLLARTIREIFPSALVAPSLMVGGTDARHYTGLTDAVYRFLPIVLQPEDIDRFHGVNERLGIEGYAQAIRFYYRLIENAAG